MVDSHCHLADPAFAADLEAVVGRARDAGLTRALCIVTAGDSAELTRAVDVARMWPEVRFSAGIHPHVAGQYAERLDTVTAVVNDALASVPLTRAIGEIGLDYHHDLSPRDVQREVFRTQVALARELKLPIVIHTREAEADTIEILRQEGHGEVTGVFHCFTGDQHAARRALDLGFLVSFAGILTFPRAADLRDAARVVPEESLLAETDSPYLAPVPFRGRRNEPVWVGRVFDTLAEIRGAPRSRIVEQVTANLTRLLRL
ncbi:MAG: TatD family hydrolase [Acidobacteria bacterium]|nr:TatD family hydrolase [Acidobacteriota bacterium]